MIFLLLFLFSFILTYAVRYIALKKSLLAKVNERSSHTTPTPHGGGIAIALTWFLGLFYFFTCKEIDARLFYALVAGGLLSIVSFMDDLYELSPKLRLLTQAFVSVLGLYALGGVTQIDFGVAVLENQLAVNALAFLGMMWFINLYNFLDGIDGYAGSEAIFLSVAAWLLFGGDHFIILTASVAGFLVWNWHKAKIFMGDVGSTLLGYNIAIFALYEQNNGTSLLVWLILFGVFWVDATVTLYRRFKNHEKLSLAHKKHAYQRLTQSGWNHSKVVKASILLNAFLVILGYIAFHFKALVLPCFGVAMVVLYAVMRFVESKKRFE